MSGIVIQPGSNFITENDQEDSKCKGPACSSSSDNEVILGLLYDVSLDDKVVQENDIHYGNPKEFHTSDEICQDFIVVERSKTAVTTGEVTGRLEELTEFPCHKYSRTNFDSESFKIPRNCLSGKCILDGLEQCCFYSTMPIHYTAVILVYL